ncbi:MAG: YtzH-like family protein [Candidatus Heimdallarchaeum aukensis]|uniref:YtzH-like family protein n=1 Tax=Candidatus Heimdallarchaeum aukensis TaxID=2876573 RepID=A0A9Y1BI20_9ARCH|nr:MAG: YtzH-like family protein [Candidatus Heimdallarchaeum aukensis]
MISRRKSLENTYNKAKDSLFELMDLLEIKIDCSYILEELEEIKHLVKKINLVNDSIVDEMDSVYQKLYKNYKDKLAAFLPPNESKKLMNSIKEWIRRLPLLF